jgi:hypothetical protein
VPNPSFQRDARSVLPILHLYRTKAKLTSIPCALISSARPMVQEAAAVSPQRFSQTLESKVWKPRLWCPSRDLHKVCSFRVYKFLQQQGKLDIHLSSPRQSPTLDLVCPAGQLSHSRYHLEGAPLIQKYLLGCSQMAAGQLLLSYQGRSPKCIVLDLDYTVWECWWVSVHSLVHQASASALAVLCRHSCVSGSLCRHSCVSAESASGEGGGLSWEYL